MIKESTKLIEYQRKCIKKINKNQLKTEIKCIKTLYDLSMFSSYTYGVYLRNSELYTYVLYTSKGRDTKLSFGLYEKSVDFSEDIRAYVDGMSGLQDAVNCVYSKVLCIE